MGIEAEFNPDLALRVFSECLKGGRAGSECIPNSLIAGKVYPFMKKGQRNYYLPEEVPLRITEGDGVLHKPIASVQILYATHYLDYGEVWTKGQYRVIDVFDADDDRPHFNGLDRIRYD